jgi:23S rRNA (cytosine1962-C5)-methyltransferase
MYRSIEIFESGSKKISQGRNYLLEGDVDSTLKGMEPGEWILLKDRKNKTIWLCMTDGNKSQPNKGLLILQKIKSKEAIISSEAYVNEKIASALDKRRIFTDYRDGSRLFFADEDGLPGLIIDEFKNVIIVQCNLYGTEKVKEAIGNAIKKRLSKKIFFMDDTKQRRKLLLPSNPESRLNENIIVCENGLEFSLESDQLQKTGWFYDHRENRFKLENLLKRLNIPKQKALDLFCYQGAWGMYCLKAGFTDVYFVDQANIEANLSLNLQRNKFQPQKFFREDVFKWLEEAQGRDETFNVVISDPPAFTQSPKDKSSALYAYQKIHEFVLKLADNNALVVLASCSQHVEEDDFFQTIVMASKVAKKNVQLLERGLQGWDHPFSITKGNQKYIKCFYLLVSDINPGEKL